MTKNAVARTITSTTYTGLQQASTRGNFSPAFASSRGTQLLLAMMQMTISAPKLPSR